MMKLLTLLLCFFSSVLLNSQTIKKVIYTDYDIEIITEEKMTFIVNLEGRFLGFLGPNSDVQIQYYENDLEKSRFAKLKSYGDIVIDYWNTAHDTDGRYGKVKSIGNIELDYWVSYNYEQDKFGKLKNIGLIQFEYWDRYTAQDEENYGKLKSIGNCYIDYWPVHPQNSGKSGKLKTFGTLHFDYWDDAFSDRDLGRFGKIKSVKGNTEKCSARLIAR